MRPSRFPYGAVLVMFCLILKPAWSQNSILTVVQGSDSGTWAVGATVNIWADPPGAGQVFDRWTGDTQSLLYPNAAHTTLVMPATSVSVRATYKNAPQWAFTTETINGVQVLSYVPPNPVGLIFALHGLTVKSTALWVTRIEGQTFCRDAVAAGYGVVAPDSIGPSGVSWDLTTPIATNPDVLNIQAIVKAFLARGAITSQTPLLAVGNSRGAFFADRAMLAVGGKAVAHVIGGGTYSYQVQLPVPEIWVMVANDSDPGVGQEGNATALDNFNFHVNRRNPGRFYTQVPTPVYPHRFWRISGMTAQDSEAVQQALKTAGLLDANNLLKERPVAPNYLQDKYLRFVPQTLKDRIPDLNTQLTTQLLVTFAEHEFTSDRNSLILELFDNAIGRRSGPTVVSTASYRPQAPLAPNSIAAVFGPGLAAATALTPSANLPTDLAGTTATVRDSAGVALPAQLFFVSQGQVNLLIPPDTAVGAATLRVIHTTARLGMPIQIARVAPGLYSANGDGRGAPAASMVRARPDGSQTYEPVASYDAAQGNFSPAPIDFGPGDDRLVLILYGTGLRNPANLAATRVAFADVSVPVQYAGPQNQFPGLDQINVEIPRSLAGRGTIAISVVVDGVSSNAVQLLFQ